jgi:hypothetical protein
MTTCTAAAIRVYFRNGTLPAPGTVCQPDFKIFEADSADVVGTFYFDIPSQSISPGYSSDLHEAAKTIRRSDFLLRSSLMGPMPALRRRSPLF